MNRATITTEGAPCGFIVNGELVQTDWNFPGTAQGIGWSLARVQYRGCSFKHLARINRTRLAAGKDCWHRSTDGTVACPECGMRPMAFISSAAEYLQSRAGR